MKRRRRGLGSSAEEHTKRFDAAAHEAEAAAGNAIAAVKDRSCAAALSYLHNMAMYMGRAQSERRAGGRQISLRTELTSKAFSVFKSSCVK